MGYNDTPPNPGGGIHETVRRTSLPIQKQYS